MARDRIQNALRRVHSDALANTTIDVYEPSESFTQGEGWDVTYPNAADATYEARVDQPDPDADRERSGTTSEVDVIIRVRDDTGQQWTGFGEETEAPARVEDAADGTMYEIRSAVKRHNGIVELEATEV